MSSRSTRSAMLPVAFVIDGCAGGGRREGGASLRLHSMACINPVHREFVDSLQRLSVFKPSTTSAFDQRSIAYQLL